MLRPFALGLCLSLFAAPAWAIEENPDESAEEDSYVPNKFTINLKAAWVHFKDDRSISDTGNVGARIGFDVCEWAQLQIGSEYQKARIDVTANDSSVEDDVGDLRMVPTYVDLRIDVTNIDPMIPWPCTWVHPEVIVGVGYMHLRLNEDSDFVGDISYHSSVFLRGGLALTMGDRKSRITFSVEFVYTWVANDLEIEESPASNNFPSKINLDYLEFGAVFTWKF